MKFKIKHETKGIIILALVSIELFFLLIVLSGLNMPLWLLWVAIAAAVLSVLLYPLEQIVGTSIIVEESSVTVKKLFGKKTIAASEIDAIGIRPYERFRRPARAAVYTEYRMQMTIALAGGDKVVLTDKATKVSGTKGFILGIRERIPDEEVELYKAYQIIRAMLKRNSQ